MLEPYNKDRPLNNHELRIQSNRTFNDLAKSKAVSQSFNLEAAKLWNLAPTSMTYATTLIIAKRAIKSLVKSFPV